MAIINGTNRNDNLVGTYASDIISGFNGNDTLNGGFGADTLIGGDGSDTYYIDNAGDVVTEDFNDPLGGVDTVFSSVNFTLGFGLENLTLTGAGNINGTGNGNNNVITGNSANNILNGGLGADTLIGGTGNDTLNGGAGSDTADYSQLVQSITLSPTGIITKAGGLGNDQLVQIETIIADASAVNNTIDVSTAGNTASINVNLQTQQLTVNGVPGVGTFTVTNFDNVKGTSQNDIIIGDAQN
ncbi:calcium-binding protein, partial [Dolichospermum planctonicum CS-1226]